MIFVAIGANLAQLDGTPPLQTCRQAVDAINRIAGLRLIRLSRWFETAPVPPSGQANYVNGVACLDGHVLPADLLAALHGIERSFGRVRGEANAARTLDLDILAMGDLIRAAPDPVIPHPRMHQRVFVLAPLRDVAPAWRHPVLGTSVERLLDALPGQEALALAMETPSS